MPIVRSLCLLFAVACLALGGTAVDDSPGRPGEWGFRPAEGQPSPVNPPGFVWRPQKGAVRYEIEVARGKTFEPAAYRASVPVYPCHCPPKTFDKGLWFWRFRFVDGKGVLSQWSRVRTFVIDDGAVAFALPARADLVARD